MRIPASVTNLDLGRTFDRLFEGARHRARIDGRFVVDGSSGMLRIRPAVGYLWLAMLLGGLQIRSCYSGPMS